MGNDVGFKDGQKIHHTLLLPGESHYFVTLEGISVQGVRLQIDPGAFARTPDHNGGCLLDTGSPWTAIHRKEYDIVKSAMQAHFSAFHLEQVPGMFDLCYLNRNQQRLPYPSMTFHFHGADLELDPTQLFLRTLDGFCFIVGPHDHEFFSVLIGSYMQTNRRFIYNTRDNYVAFAREECKLAS
ncbi:hypothetical protein IFM89_030473 [Coptis chinensis]|uniref:Peptidase A1 domain-containing protein n=1 Tax=Coptis chinensis TaxID=261450 RepID=A0A835H7Q1_9MAGN|nr:hypothetical protein IFM89_030473 [Coptis chinensis]